MDGRGARKQHGILRKFFSILNRVKMKYILTCVVFLILLQFFGVFTHIFELDFHTQFDYPMTGDIRKYIIQLRSNEKPSTPPINEYNYTFISTNHDKCKLSDLVEQLKLVYIVKSAVDNFDRRKAIRNSWGFQARFSDVQIRTVFILGIRPLEVGLQTRVDAEQKKYNDIVQANFIDTYYNNTIKTMMGIKWAVTFCNRSKFYMFSDDDMYVSTKNVLRFVRNPTNYPKYLEDPIFTLKLNGKSRSKRSKRLFVHNDDYNSIDSEGRRGLKQFVDFELDDEVRLFAGYVFFSAPLRHYTSKWQVSLAEYPYHMWPPYVTAGAYILSWEALLDIHYGSFYTQHFRFDDIYLGLIAKKADLEPYHCDEFHFYKKPYSVHDYKYVIASHGYSDPKELTHVWNEQKSAGNA